MSLVILLHVTSLLSPIEFQSPMELNVFSN